MSDRQRYDLRVWCQTCSGVIGVLEGIEQGQGIGTSTGLMVKMTHGGTFIGIERLVREAVTDHQGTAEHRRRLAERKATP